MQEFPRGYHAGDEEEGEMRGERLKLNKGDIIVTGGGGVRREIHVITLRYVELFNKRTGKIELIRRDVLSRWWRDGWVEVVPYYRKVKES